MPDPISAETVRHIAYLSRLEIADSEIPRVSAQLNSILQYVDKLRELDTDGVPPTAHTLRQKNVFREDEVLPSLTKEQVLINAPETENGHFKVPQIIQES